MFRLPVRFAWRVSRRYKMRESALARIGPHPRRATQTAPLARALEELGFFRRL